ncbi:unnamed protein product [Sphagnum jensenii]|uniref:Ribosome-recycling factor, chloroplastic n=1 Tax=Sphagnum jensenii TaxID=128206 RepID=A0ABP0W4E6_9BRYO
MAAATGSRLYRLRASVVPSLAALCSRALDPFVYFAVPDSHDHKEPGFLSPELTRPACTSSRLDSSFCVTDHLRYGGTLGACELDAWHLGLGSSYGVRGFAKAKKIKARSDYDRDEALESVVPSAKETATELMEAAMDALAKDLAKLRTGRASPGMLDHVTVESHGVRVPLPHVAAVSMPNLETLTVMPYDPSTLKEVEKAILGSPLRLNPILEGQVLKVPIPKLTKEHCESMCKLVGKAGETAKLSVRRARKDALDLLGKGSGFSKDEIKRYEKEVEEVTKKYVKSVDETCKQREKEILAG